MVLYLSFSFFYSFSFSFSSIITLHYQKMIVGTSFSFFYALPLFLLQPSSSSLLERVRLEQVVKNERSEENKEHPSIYLSIPHAAVLLTPGGYIKTAQT
jgi:hypothetical protein